MKDLIDRQDAINALNKLDVSDGVGISSVACCLQEEAIRSIENLPSAQPEQRWIPCSERLPEYGEAVLTINEDEDYEINHIIDEDNGEWFCDGVIAWMPLPEPYREDDHETD